MWLNKQKFSQSLGHLSTSARLVNYGQWKFYPQKSLARGVGKGRRWEGSMQNYSINLCDNLSDNESTKHCKIVGDASSALS